MRQILWRAKSARFDEEDFIGFCDSLEGFTRQSCKTTKSELKKVQYVFSDNSDNKVILEYVVNNFSPQGADIALQGSTEELIKVKSRLEGWNGPLEKLKDIERYHETQAEISRERYEYLNRKHM